MPDGSTDDVILRRLDGIEATLGGRVQRVEDRLEEHGAMLTEFRSVVTTATETLKDISVTLQASDKRAEEAWKREQKRLDDAAQDARDHQKRVDEQKAKFFGEAWTLLKPALATFLAVAFGALTAGGVGYRFFAATGLPPTPTPLEIRANGAAPVVPAAPALDLRPLDLPPQEPTP